MTIGDATVGCTPWRRRGVLELKPGWVTAELWRRSAREGVGHGGWLGVGLSPEMAEAAVAGDECEGEMEEGLR